MTQLTFLLDKEKDAENIWSIINEKPAYKNNRRLGFSKELISFCQGKKFEECREKILEYTRYFYESNIINTFIEALSKLWSEREVDFFNRLKNLTGKGFEEKIIAYITIGTICPYDPEENWFMVSLFSNLVNSLVVCGHEILHLHFHKYYFEELAKRVGNKKAHDIKESFSVLLNLEFKDLLLGFDEGYEEHKEIRKKIVEEWKSGKNIEEIIEALC